MLNKSSRYIRYLIHPYLIWRTLIRHFEVKNSQKHRTRLEEYDNLSLSFESFIDFLTNKGNQVNKKVKELKKDIFLTYIRDCVEESQGYGGCMIGDLGILLYLLVRIISPEYVVETGVANGFSSSFILKALNDNQKGKLYSIDLHLREGVSVPPGKKIGWVIPNELRCRWVLKLGQSHKVLPTLLEQLGEIDIFLHDSRHLYKTMTTEYKIAWPYLKLGGLLLSDDIRDNDAFLDFSYLVQVNPAVFNSFGGIKKSTRTL